jgi:IS30 family transposase
MSQPEPQRLIRQYVPKGSRSAELTVADVALIQNKLNSHPRTRISYAAPSDIFTAPHPVVPAA